MKCIGSFCIKGDTLHVIVRLVYRLFLLSPPKSGWKLHLSCFWCWFLFSLPFFFILACHFEFWLQSLLITIVFGWCLVPKSGNGRWIDCPFCFYFVRFGFRCVCCVSSLSSRLGSVQCANSVMWDYVFVVTLLWPDLSSALVPWLKSCSDCDLATWLLKSCGIINRHRRNLVTCCPVLHHPGCSPDL